MAFVVNPHGAVHSVPDEWLDELLSRGYRLATDDEIEGWYKAQGLEVSGGAGKYDAADQPGERSYRRSRRG